VLAVKNFQEVWQHFDPTATRYIKTVDFKEFLLRLDSPMGLSGSNFLAPGNATNILTARQNLTYNKIIEIYDIPDRDGKLYYPEVLWPMMFMLFGHSNEVALAN